MSIIGDILCLNEEVDRVVVSNVKIDWVCFCILDEQIDLSFGKEIECNPIVFCGVVVGVHEVVVGLHEPFPFR